MTATENKAALTTAFEATAQGDGRPLVRLMSDDVTWTVMGSGDWARTWTGKEAVVKDLLGRLAALFDGPNTVSAQRFLAEDDLVVVEATNHSSTKAGQPYPNRYAFIFRMEEGRIVEVREYCDTRLVADVLGPYAEASAAQA